MRIMEEVATTADVANSSNDFSLLTGPHHGISGIVNNSALMAAFLAFFLAQSLKVFTTWYKEKRWDFKRMVSSGGMPSSHSSCAMGLATSVGLREGPGSPLFAMCMVFAGVVMYDASGVRLHAGRQAEVLNQIVYELPPEHPLADSRPLREVLGHTPPQVLAGALLGCVTAYFLYMLFPDYTMPILRP
eukprot:TRINITY_DN18948_c0_g1_i1.p1 TRINITY_DN18948_c0_g1~~TRINITY_DN18948_c0_g1_i1.p1  ORF type:complete len:188 (+),score=13.32 TRINITY_DN18948_c0_g1_i1:324-887(+)